MADFVTLGGLPWKADDQSQAAQMVQAGGQAISQQEAQEANSAQQDLSYVDENWGVAGKAGMGALSGLTLGMGPGALAKLGLLDPGHAQAAQTSGWYTAGDVAGTLLPTLFTGGENLAARGLSMTPAGIMGLAGTASERLAGGLLGESAGVLGRLGATPFKMAARGSAEGALISMGHAIGDNLIQNKPFTAESLATAGLDGALFGGLIGGSLGAVGSLGTMAIESVGSLAKGALGRYGAEGVALRSIGMDAAPEIGANKINLKLAQETLEKGGGGIGESLPNNQKAAINAKTQWATERGNVVGELTKAHVPAPDIVSLEARFKGELLAPNLGTASEGIVRKEIDSVMERLKYIQPEKTLKAEAPAMTEKEFLYSDTRPDAKSRYSDYKSTFRDTETKVPGQSPSWEKLIQSRDQLAKDLVGPMRSDIINIIDDTISRSMKVTTPGMEGLAEKYAAATQGLKMAEHLEEVLGKKAAQSVMNARPAITGRDMAYAAAGAVAGHPGVALTALAGKGVASKLLSRIEPAMAKMAYNSAMGVKAANATSEVKAKIGSSLTNFFKTATKAPARTAQVSRAESYKKVGGSDRKSYEESASRTEQLTSPNHQTKVRKFAEGLHKDGFTELAGALMGVNNRAVQYLLWNAPPRAATKGMVSLREQPVSKVLSHREYQYSRMKKGVTDPMSVLDDLENGNISREQVQAMKYVYPELHNEIVLQAGNKVAEMKAKGDAMPMDKIVSLCIALDSALDPALTGEYVGAVQMALNAPPPNAEPQPQGPPMGQPGAPIVMSTDLMTPLQTSAMNG